MNRLTGWVASDLTLHSPLPVAVPQRMDSERTRAATATTLYDADLYPLGTQVLCNCAGDGNQKIRGIVVKHMYKVEHSQRYMYEDDEDEGPDDTSRCFSRYQIFLFDTGQLIHAHGYAHQFTIDDSVQYELSAGHQLLVACLTGDLAALQRILRSHYDGFDLLQIEASSGLLYSEDVARCLTPLYGACGANRADVVEYLLSFAASSEQQLQAINTPRSFNRTALCVACYQDSVDCARVLLDAGADIEHGALGGRNNQVETNLHAAVFEGSTACVRLLLDRRAALSSEDRTYEYKGTDCLFIAARHGYVDIVDMLISAGVDVNDPPQPSRQTALYAACFESRYGTAERLLAAHADPSIATSGQGKKPLDVLGDGRRTDYLPEICSMVKCVLEDASKRNEELMARLEEGNRLAPADLRDKIVNELEPQMFEEFERLNEALKNHIDHDSLLRTGLIYMASRENLLSVMQSLVQSDKAATSEAAKTTTHCWTADTVIILRSQAGFCANRHARLLSRPKLPNVVLPEQVTRVRICIPETAPRMLGLELGVVRESASVRRIAIFSVSTEGLAFQLGLFRVGDVLLKVAAATCHSATCKCVSIHELTDSCASAGVRR